MPRLVRNMRLMVFKKAGKYLTRRANEKKRFAHEFYKHSECPTDHDNGLYKAHKSAMKETTWAFTSKLKTDEKKMRKGTRREWDVM